MDMEIKEVNCSMCNHPLNISKENVYVAFFLESISVIGGLFPILASASCGRSHLSECSSTVERAYT